MGTMAGRHWGNKRHNICSFPSKMKPALARTLVKFFTRPGSKVLDPFSGSGTVPFEAALSGCRAVGTDLSPLGRVLTSAKVCPPDEEELRAMQDSLCRCVEDRWKTADLALMEPEIRDFYHERTALEIIAARDYLSKVTDGFQHSEPGLFIAACMVHLLHGNRPYALSRRSHNIIPIPPKGALVYKSVSYALKRKIDRVLSCRLPPNFQKGQSLQCAAHTLPLEDRSVDAVITSPPFFGTTDFLRQNRIRLWFLGWSYSLQASRKREFLEHNQSSDCYKPILGELSRILAQGGLIIFHVGVVKKRNMADFLAPLFTECGFAERGRVWEDARTLETHGRTDRGGTHTHGFLVARK